MLPHLCNKSTSSRILTKQAMHGPESKLLQTSHCKRSKKQIVLYTLALRWCNLFSPGQKQSHSSLHWDYIPFFVKCNQSEKPVQRKLQNVEQNERNHKREQEWRTQMDTKCTAHGLVMTSFIFTPAAGQPNQCRKILPTSTHHLIKPRSSLH